MFFFSVLLRDFFGKLLFNTICDTSFFHVEFIPKEILPYAIKKGNISLFFFLYGLKFHLDDHQELANGGTPYFYFTITETEDTEDTEDSCINSSNNFF